MSTDETFKDLGEKGEDKNWGVIGKRSGIFLSENEYNFSIRMLPNLLGNRIVEVEASIERTTEASSKTLWVGDD